MWESKKGLILTIMTLEISLYNRLHKEIGLKSAKVEALSFLGIKARKVEFSEGGIKLKTLADSTVDNKSFLSKSKKCK